MIAKAEKKIEYLDELKQSLITRAVIRGLESQCTTKDSEISGLAKSEHWKVCLLNIIANYTKDLHFQQIDPTATGVSCNSYGQIPQRKIKCDFLKKE